MPVTWQATTSFANSLTQSRGMCSLCGMLPPGVTWRAPSPGSPEWLGLQRRSCRGWRCMCICSSLAPDEAWGERTPSPAWMHSMLRELHLPDLQGTRVREKSSLRRDCHHDRYIYSRRTKCLRLRGHPQGGCCGIPQAAQTHASSPALCLRSTCQCTAPSGKRSLHQRVRWPEWMQFLCPVAN